MQLRKILLSAVLCGSLVASNAAGVVGTANAASEYDSSSNIAIGVIGTVNTNATFELSPSNWFKSDDDFGKDMYKAIYERVKGEGSNLAVKRALEKKSLSRDELFNVMYGSSISEVTQRAGKSDTLTPLQIEDRRAEIQQFVAEEKQLADLEVDALLEVQPTEFFSNGDESDSGFDLISDLDVIEKILFGTQETPMGNGGPGAPPGANVADIAGLFGGNAAGNAGQNPGGAGGNQGAGNNIGGQGGAGAGNGDLAGDGSEENGIACPANQQFSNAISQMREQERGGGGAGGNGNAAGAGGAGNGAGANNAGGYANRDDSIKRDANGSVLPETPGNYTRQAPCDGIFCIKYEAIYKTDSSYVASDNCIACHFEKINDAFKKTLDHNLVPSKATGNFLEGPKCKRSMFNLKQNFILIPQPIMTPPNDDLITKGDFVKNTKDFFAKYFGAKVDRAQITKRVLEQATDGANQKEINKRIEAEVAAETQKATDLLRQTLTTAAATNQASQYRVLMQEIDQMNTYFESFVKLFTDLTSGDNDSPCKVLQNKATCS